VETMGPTVEEGLMLLVDADDLSPLLNPKPANSSCFVGSESEELPFVSLVNSGSLYLRLGAALVEVGSLMAGRLPGLTSSWCCVTALVGVLSPETRSLAWWVSEPVGGSPMKFAGNEGIRLILGASYEIQLVFGQCFKIENFGHNLLFQRDKLCFSYFLIWKKENER
jgi:hypothetical protein